MTLVVVQIIDKYSPLVKSAENHDIVLKHINDAVLDAGNHTTEYNIIIEKFKTARDMFPAENDPDAENYKFECIHYIEELDETKKEVKDMVRVDLEALERLPHSMCAVGFGQDDRRMTCTLKEAYALLVQPETCRHDLFKLKLQLFSRVLISVP